MNIQERRRFADIVNTHYRALCGELKDNSTNEEVEAEIKILVSAGKLKASIDKLEKFKASVRDLEESIGNAVEELYGPFTEKSSRGRCDCPKHFTEMLKEAATANLAKQRDTKTKRDKLERERNQALAKIETAATVDDARKVLIKIGLIEG